MDVLSVAGSKDPKADVSLQGPYVEGGLSLSAVNTFV